MKKRVYRINTGSCGACDRIIQRAIATDDSLLCADSPHHADVFVVTGALVQRCRAALLTLLREYEYVPVLVIGRCAIDGQPFGKGGVQDNDDVVVQLQCRIDGCPVGVDAVCAAIHQHARMVQ